MKIAVAQTKPFKGNIEANIASHLQLIEFATIYKVDLIIFPELSITGYEPGLANSVVITIDDNRFNDFQKISDEKNITIGIGAPLKGDNGIFISMIIFEPGQPIKIYSKTYLHADEEPFFINGQQQIFLKKDNHIIAPAICYELSVPEHAEQAHENSADIYLVSVAKTDEGMGKAIQTLSNTAANYSMTVLLSNCVGYCDNFLSAGRSSIWNKKGDLIGQLNDADEGLLIFDTKTEQVIIQYFSGKTGF